MKKKLNGEFLFLFILFVFAVITTKGYTIAWGLLPLFLAFKIDKNRFNYPSIKKSGIVLLLFFIVFCLNFLAIFSFDDFQIKIPHPDFHYYLKVASFFNETGIENNLTAKTVLFDNLNMATPYRFFDTWILAFLIWILPFNDLVVLQVFYLSVLWFMVSFSVYRNLDLVKNNLFRVFLSISFLFFFGDKLTSLIGFNGSNGEISVVSYPKLAIFFCVFIYYLRSQLEDKNKHDSILFLAFLPILIQTTFSLYIFIYIYMIVYYKYFLSNKRIVISVFFSSFYFVVFYGYNSYLSKEIFQMGQFQFVKSLPEYFHRIVSIGFNLVKTKLLFFIIISFVLLLASNKNKRIIYLRMLVLAIGILVSSIFIYALFPSSPNSYQLMTNFTFPVFITLVFFMGIDRIWLMKNQRILYHSFIVCFAIAGIYNQFHEYGFFNVKDVYLLSNDKKFVFQSQQILEKVKNPIGLTYWSEKNESRSNSEHFDEYGTNFLIKLGGNFDTVCLSALHFKGNEYSEIISKHYSAIGIFQRTRKISNKNIEEIFYKHYNFEYLISDLSINYLPKYIKIDIIENSYDSKSKIYCYRLKKI
jgi:hypothetical protein